MIMPKMATDEIVGFATASLGSHAENLSYEELVRVATKASYLLDRCMAEIARRGEITYLDGAPIMPDARPDSLMVETPFVAGTAHLS